MNWRSIPVDQLPDPLPEGVSAIPTRCGGFALLVPMDAPADVQAAVAANEVAPLGKTQAAGGKQVQESPVDGEGNPVSLGLGQAWYERDADNNVIEHVIVNDDGTAADPEAGPDA